MKRRDRKQHLVSEINITPFTDVILVLLVIFMITTPLVLESHLTVNLPEAKSGKAGGGAHQEKADIALTREGMIYLDGKVVTRKELKEKIRLMQKNSPDLNVIVRADKLVRFQEVVDILDPLTELGITKLNIAAINEE
ncbi:MAG: biopolymer transporter ExbD [Candidatus Omnitrophica bacterium]|nr:biopolymer transporter ExbD [Candidatus Omnitrophota bacterium]